MAKPTILKERGTGEELYPRTLASLVHTSTGENVEEAVDEAKFKLFDDQWTAAGGTVIVSGVTYGLNGLNDLTYDEAIGVYASYPLCKHLFTDRRGMFSGIKDRTLLPIRTNSFEVTGYIEAFLSCPNLVAVKFITAGNNPIVSISNGQNMFKNCPSLKYIYDTLVFGSNANLSGTFELCPSLEKVRIKNLMKSLSMAHSPKLSLDSISYMVANAANTATITITVHPDVYAKLTGDTTNAAAATLTEEEAAAWQQVLADANVKNISFACL